MSLNTSELQPRVRTVSRADFWQRHVAQCKESGLSKMAYCQQNALTYHQMVYWSGKEKSKIEAEVPSSGFIPVKTVAAAAGADLLIRLPNGITIEGVNERSMELVRKLIEQL